MAEWEYLKGAGVFAAGAAAVTMFNRVNALGYDNQDAMLMGCFVGGAAVIFISSISRRLFSPRPSERYSRHPPMEDYRRKLLILTGRDGVDESERTILHLSAAVSLQQLHDEITQLTGIDQPFIMLVFDEQFQQWCMPSDIESISECARVRVSISSQNVQEPPDPNRMGVPDEHTHPTALARAARGSRALSLPTSSVSISSEQGRAHHTSERAQGTEAPPKCSGLASERQGDEAEAEVDSLKLNDAYACIIKEYSMEEDDEQDEALLMEAFTVFDEFFNKTPW
jgi:hypothetical protein